MPRHCFVLSSNLYIPGLFDAKIHVALTVIETLKNVTKICLVCGEHIQRYTYTRSILAVCHQMGSM